MRSACAYRQSYRIANIFKYCVPPLGAYCMNVDKRCARYQVCFSRKSYLVRPVCADNALTPKCTNGIQLAVQKPPDLNLAKYRKFAKLEKQRIQLSGEIKRRFPPLKTPATPSGLGTHVRFRRDNGPEASEQTGGDRAKAGSTLKTLRQLRCFVSPSQVTNRTLSYP